jgi:hypothetical protein
MLAKGWPHASQNSRNYYGSFLTSIQVHGQSLHGQARRAENCVCVYVVQMTMALLLKAYRVAQPSAAILAQSTQFEVLLDTTAQSKYGGASF